MAIDRDGGGWRGRDEKISDLEASGWRQLGADGMDGDGYEWIP